MVVGNKFCTWIFIWVQKKTVWENELTKQGHAIAPRHIKNAWKITEKSKYVGHRGQA